MEWFGLVFRASLLYTIDGHLALRPPEGSYFSQRAEVGGLKIFPDGEGSEGSYFPGGLKFFRRSESQKYMLNSQYSMLNRWALGPPKGRKTGLFPEVGGLRFFRRAQNFSGGPKKCPSMLCTSAVATRTMLGLLDTAASSAIM